MCLLKMKPPFDLTAHQRGSIGKELMIELEMGGFFIPHLPNARLAKMKDLSPGTGHQDRGVSGDEKLSPAVGRIILQHLQEFKLTGRRKRCFRFVQEIKPLEAEAAAKVGEDPFTVRKGIENPAAVVLEPAGVAQRHVIQEVGQLVKGLGAEKGP